MGVLQGWLLLYLLFQRLLLMMQQHVHIPGRALIISLVKRL